MCYRAAKRAGVDSRCCVSSAGSSPLASCCVRGGRGAVGYVIWDASKDLPDYKQLATYEPPVMTRIHAADGSLLAEYAEERRLFVPVNQMPKRLIEAFISAEDKTFFTHGGLDWQGIAAAAYRYAQVKLTGKGQIVGASTITQQVAKNFLLTNERSIERKLKEALLVQRIEQTFSKDQILELYLNEIFLGLNSYGVAAASLNYFGKSLDQLSLEEMAYLAALPKGPNNYHPFRQKERAIERRNWVLAPDVRERLHHRRRDEAGAGQAARGEPAALRRAALRRRKLRRGSAPRARRASTARTSWRRAASRSAPRSIRSCRSMRARRWPAASSRFDRKRGFRGPVAKRRTGGESDWGHAAEGPQGARRRRPLAPRRRARRERDEAADRPAAASSCRTASWRPSARPARSRSTLLKWARAYVDGTQARPRGEEGRRRAEARRRRLCRALARTPGQFHLVQMPDVEGALVAMDPHTGRVLALVGGFSYGRSQFNRAVQALRQPGSSFKPIVYAAALDNGYSPASVVLDAPVEFKMADGKMWKPKNYQNKFFGPSTLRRGIEQSRNVMTVRLADELGMTKIADLAHAPRHLRQAAAPARHGAGCGRDDAAEDGHRLCHDRQWRQEDRRRP